MPIEQSIIHKEDALQEITISHDNQFAIQQNKLKEFSRQLPRSISLPTASNSSWFSSCGRDRVTSSDVNNIAKAIQDRMIEQNKCVINIIQQFETVYATFSSLDKVYLQKIIQSFNAAVKANEKANESMMILNKQQNEIRENQKDIGQIISQQKSMIEVLKNFKEKLEKVKYLTDVDAIYGNVQKIQSNVDALIKTTNNLKADIEKVSKELDTRITQASQKSEQQFDKLSKDVDKKIAQVSQNAEQQFAEQRTNLDELSKDSDGKYKIIQSELNKTQNENAMLSKALTRVKGIAIASIASSAISIVLFILLLVVVLR